MSEIIFEVRAAEGGGFWARALGESIFTQGEDWDQPQVIAKDAVACRFENPAAALENIRRQLGRDEGLAA